MFLGWTQDLASSLGVPRVVFWSPGAYAASIFNCLWHDLPKPDDPNNQGSVLSLNKVPGCPKYPWRQISDLYRDYKREDPDWEYFRKTLLANDHSWGVLFNSSPELEGTYINYFKKEIGHDRVWAVGPLVPAYDEMRSCELRNWLDSKGADQVVYICFGSPWALTEPQVTALATALESSGVSFFWVLKDPDLSNTIFDGFKERVRGTRFVIKGWASQVEMLGHEAVGAFVTHCRWNSVLEGIRARVLMLTWPLLADQFYNAKFLDREIGVAVSFCEGGREVVPESTELARLLDESVDTSFRLQERVRIKELQKVAIDVSKGGSLDGDLEDLVKQLRLQDA